MSQLQSGLLPRKVLLFSGHMIDGPGRAEPRFPPDKERVAADAIANTLTRIDTGPGDLAICGGACGGDLLFAESALARGAGLELYIPFDEPTFLAKSVDFADANWHARFLAARSRATFHVMPDERGPLLTGADPYELNNLWMLESAERFGVGKVHFVCLWNGQGGDGPGGTQHLMEEVRRKSGRVHWLNTTQLWTQQPAAVDPVVLDPDIPSINLRGEFEQTLNVIRRQIEDPCRDNYWVLADLALVEVLLGRSEPAAAYAHFIALSPPDFAYISALASLRPLVELPIPSATLRAAVALLEDRLEK